MAFTMPSFPILNAEQVNPFHAAIKNALNMYGEGIQKQYLPKLLQADIFSKQFAPLAQIASNPLAMAMMGDKGQGIMQMISQLLQQQGSNGASQTSGGSSLGNFLGMGSNPTPTQGAVSSGTTTVSSDAPPFEMPGSSVGVAGSSGNAMSLPQTTAVDQSTSNIPQAGGTTGSGLVAKALAPANMQIYPAASVYQDPKTKHFKNTLTPNVLSQDQTGMGAIQTTIPLMRNLEDEGDQVVGLANKLKAIKSPQAARQLYNAYLQFNRDQKNVLGGLKSAKNWRDSDQAAQEAAAIISPGFFEDPKAYRASMEKEIGNLMAQNKAYSGQVTGGFDVTPGHAPDVVGRSQAIARIITPDGKIWRLPAKNADQAVIRMNKALKKGENKARVLSYG